MHQIHLKIQANAWILKKTSLTKVDQNKWHNCQAQLQLQVQLQLELIGIILFQSTHPSTTQPPG